MIQGKIKNVIPLLKNLIKTRLESIDFEDSKFETHGVEDVLSYCEDMLNMINAIYQDYLVEVFTIDSMIEINLKNFTYKRI